VNDRSCQQNSFALEQRSFSFARNTFSFMPNEVSSQLTTSTCQQTDCEMGGTTVTMN